ncbi:hypothetical protein AVEN_222317-1 [Araneus ventricosus]|uniref:Uncharacterized protein n=1 Tax=Araneus ventricosus TaxID=182803 RepID=A0A4Y2EVQ1_ARAVE|nr:hypothetical protein AVEN_222317-1 [Araneus ventricosus]
MFPRIKFNTLFEIHKKQNAAINKEEYYIFQINICSEFPIGSSYTVLNSGELLIHGVLEKDSQRTFHCQTRHRLTGEMVMSVSAGKIVVTEILSAKIASRWPGEKASTVDGAFQRFRRKLLEHPLQSPDNKLSDFQAVEKGDRGFRAEAEVQQTVLTQLHDLDTDMFYAGFNTAVYRWNNASTTIVNVCRSNMYQNLTTLFISLNS